MTNAAVNINPFFNSLKIQFRVIHALFMREIITRYGRHNIGFLWLFLEPMLFTAGVAAIWTYSGNSHSGMPVISFAITGYSSVLLWRNMPGRCATAVAPNLALMYHRNVKVLDLFISRIILEFMAVSFSFIALSWVCVFLNLMPPPEDISKIIIGWLMLTWFGAGLGITIGALTEMTELVEKFWHIIVYLTFPLSGSMFMVDWLPKALQSFVLALPMVHGVEILRSGYYGSTVKAHYDIQYMAFICLCLTFTGLVLTKIVSQRVMPE